MPNFEVIERNAEQLNQTASTLLLVIRDFQRAKAPGGDDLTVSQKQTLRTNFLAALTGCEASAQAIRTELAS